MTPDCFSINMGSTSGKRVASLRRHTGSCSWVAILTQPNRLLCRTFSPRFQFGTVAKYSPHTACDVTGTEHTGSLQIAE
ncbi:hypothetical protein JOQ06_020245, partial [Pogonophryne albipinna]